ncbi:unnamed protein product [Mucor hiemalis]
MQHHLYSNTNNSSLSKGGDDATSTNSSSNNDGWHSNIWQHRSPSTTTTSDASNMGRLTNNILSSSPSLPTLPPVTSSTSLLQSRYYPSSSSTSSSSNNTSSYAPLPSSTSFYQPYPTSTLPRSNSASALSSSLYRQSSLVTKPISRPRLTTTLWEDESTLCYQVDSRGICVARRQDNDMINGTKLLNVAGMSRGKRDGILKNERGRIVVKVGAMHLKGVWIPFVRAKALASQFKIFDMLYPIFSDDPASFLYPSHYHQMNRYNNGAFNSSSSLLNNSMSATNSGSNLNLSRPGATDTSTDNFYSRYTPYNHSTSSPSTDFLSNRISESTSTVPIKSYSDNNGNNTSSNDSLGIFHTIPQPSRSLYYSQQQDGQATTDNSTGGGNGNSSVFSSIQKRTETNTIGSSSNNGDDKEGK